MPWTGSTGSQLFQRTDGTRTGSQTWQQADAAGIDIVSPDHDTHDQDISDGLSACFKKDGGNTATSDLPMGGFRFKNIGNAVIGTDSASATDVQANRLSQCSVGGTANVITLTNTVPIAAYANGQEFKFFASFSNSSSVTVAVDGLSAKNITVAGIALSAGQIIAGTAITIRYSSTLGGFELLASSATPAAITVGMVQAWPMTTVPTGWLECDGSAISRTTYSALYAVIGTSYGVGDGSTTFNLPNYKDYFLRGYSATGTEASSRTDRGDGTTGASVGTKQADAFLRHNHTASVTDPGHTHNVNQVDTTAPRVISGGSNFGNTNVVATTSATTGISVAVANTSTGDSTAETRSKNITVKWIILASPSGSYAIGTGVLFGRSITDLTLTDGASAQAAFNISATGAVTVAGSTAYDIDMLLIGTNTGTTSHTWGILFAGSATITAAGTLLKVSSYTATSNALTTETGIYIVGANISSVTAITAASTSATENVSIRIRGTININAGGTLIPQVKFSAQPNGTEKILAGSFIQLTPLGSNTVTQNGVWS
jgi:microcystin-dependent protein